MTCTKCTALLLLAILTANLNGVCDSPQAIAPWCNDTGQLVLVDDGGRAAPIVIFAGAPPITRQAADELADYIEKTSGARPEVIEGTPDPLPATAIWVGYQPVLQQVFPAIDFAFAHPEEILIAANENHLVIAGRDVWNPDALVVTYGRKTVNGVQSEYGTANAVYTFIQEGLGVRWLWPGEMGEDILPRKTIAVDPFVHRYHPRFRARSGLLRYSALERGGPSRHWTRRQRLQLSSLRIEGGHSFVDWWDRFHETHPEYFALQPDGTRSGFPEPRKAKLCESSPAVWDRWMADVEQQLEADPTRTVFSAVANDSWASGHCICENCRAWDHPAGELRTFRWAGLGQDYVALADRQVTFANILARKLKARYPDKDYFVSIAAYGHSRPAPIEAVPDANVIILSVANFLLHEGLADRGSPKGVTYKEQFDDWSKLKPNLLWRPNLTSPAGGYQGQPDVPIRQGIADIKYVAERNCIGIYVDSVWEHWGTYGPLYYVLGQLVWDPSKDGQAILDDYYRRGFGPAASQIKAYWQRLEMMQARCAASDRPQWEIYDEAFFAQASELLGEAKGALAGEPAVYTERVAFFEAGLEWTQLVIQLRRIMATMRDHGVLIPELDEQARANWRRMEEIAKGSYAIRWSVVMPHTPRMRHLHPDYLSFESTTSAKAPAAIEQGDSDAVYGAATDQGWTLAFRDDFERADLGDDWQVLTGEWRIEDGALCGAGTIALARGYPTGDDAGYQRLEFEATTAAPKLDMGLAGKSQSRISDLSSFIHADAGATGMDVIQTGYFFQFGGHWNTRNRLLKNGAEALVSKDPEILITPEKPHHIVVENDEGRLKLFVDQRPVLDLKESGSIVGKGHDRAGFYFHTRVKVESMRLYVKPLANDLDRY